MLSPLRIEQAPGGPGIAQMILTRVLFFYWRNFAKEEKLKLKIENELIFGDFSYLIFVL
jgi:hypothetical protein